MRAGLNAPTGTAVNEQVGNYVLRRYLTQGGMAELFLAHRVGGRDVVVAKRILPQFSRDLSFTRMFTREAHLASLLRHPNIIQVHDAGGLETEGCYFVMEYLHGVDLTRFLSVLRDRNLTMPLDHALTIVTRMCAGLHYAHNMVGQDGRALEIVHRDVSPSNVMVAYNGDIKVMDFGVAKALALTSFTEAGTRKGKLSYMAPEQARADALDRRADVFAIGAVLYELTTMQRLFTGGNELAVIHQLMYEARTPPSTVVSGYPSALEKIVLKAVEHKPEDRYTSAAALGEALEGFAAQAGLTLGTQALGKFLGEQIVAPPHPADDPAFFGGAADVSTPGAATAIERVGLLETAMGPLSDGGGLVTNASPSHGAAAYPTTTAPYVAAPPAALVPAAPTRAGGSHVSGGTGAGLVAAAILTLAASGGVAYFLTRADDAKPPAVIDTTTPVTTKAPVKTQTPVVAPAALAVPTPAVVPTSPDPAVVEPPVQDDPQPPVVADVPRPVKKKKRKKKAAAVEPKPAPATPAEPATTKKKKRSPTDTLLPIVPG